MTTLRVETRQFSATSAASNLPRLHLASLLGVTPCEFCRDFRRQKTRDPALSSGVVSVILRLPISVEHLLVTDGQTDRHTTTAIARATMSRAGKKYKNSSGDDISNVNIYAVRLEGTRIR